MHSPSLRGSSYDPTKKNSFSTAERKLFEHSLRIPLSSPCLSLKVFYVKLHNYEFHKSAPEYLSVNFTPLSPETVAEVNGGRSGLSTPFVSSTLRRDRIDEKSEEAIFVSTDSIRTTGSMRFEVYGRENLLLFGVLELSVIKKWSMKFVSSVVSWPAVEVYVTGVFSGSAIVLTETLYLGKKKNNQLRLALDSVPEDEVTEMVKKDLPEGPQQLMKYEDFATEDDLAVCCNSSYRRSEHIEVDDDGELSLFIAGVTVGVGIGLSICLCVGLGTDLLLRTYRTTSRTFWKLL